METGFKSLYLLSRQTWDGIGDRTLRNCPLYLLAPQERKTGAARGAGGGRGEDGRSRLTRFLVHKLPAQLVVHFMACLATNTARRRKRSASCHRSGCRCHRCSLLLLTGAWKSEKQQWLRRASWFGGSRGSVFRLRSSRHPTRNCHPAIPMCHARSLG